MQSQKKEWPYLLIIIFIFMAVFHRFYNHAIVYSDSFSFFSYSKQQVADALRGLTIYKWDPRILLGMPAVGQAQTGWFYPLNIIYLLRPFALAHRVFILIHYPLAAIFMYLFLRGRKLDGPSALFGGLVFSLSGYMTGHHANLIVLVSSAWVPLAFYAIDRALNEGSGWALVAGAVLSIEVYGGEPEVSAITAFLLAAVCIHRAAVASSERLSALKALFITALSSIVLSAAQTFPAIELLMNSERGRGISAWESLLFSFHPGRLAELVWPLPFGVLWPKAYYWGEFAIDKVIAPNPWIISNYMGLTTLVLAAVGIFLNNRKWKSWLGLGMIASLLLAFGRYTPLYAAVHSIVPMFNWFRYPERILGWFSGFAAVAASLGFDHVRRMCAEKPSELTRSVLFYMVALAGVTAAAAFIWPMIVVNVTVLDAGTEEYNKIMGDLFGGGAQMAAVNMVMCAVGLLAAKRLLSGKTAVSLFLAALVLDLYMTNVNQMPPGPKDIYEIPSIAAEVIAPEKRPALGEYRIVKYDTKYFKDPNFLSEYSDVTRLSIWKLFVLDDKLHAFEGFEGFGGYISPQPSDGFHLMRMKAVLNVTKDYNVKYLITSYRKEPLVKDDNARIIYRNPKLNMTIIEHPDFLPRAYWVSSATTAADEREATRKVLSVDLRKTVVLTTNEMITNANKSDGEFKPAVIKSYEPDEVVIECDAPAAGWLVLSDRYFGGWKATVDGQAAQIYKANVMVRALPMPSGKHAVIFRYKPLPFYIGGAISLFGWLSILIFGCVAAARKIFALRSP